MKSVLLSNENGVFEFLISDVIEFLNIYKSETHVPEADAILEFLSNSPDDLITIPGNYNYFKFIALDLVESGKGTVTCKLCNRLYRARELKQITVGHGKSPFDVRFSWTWRLKNIFRRPKLPGMFGGKGYECPKGHRLIAMVTWRT